MNETQQSWETLADRQRQQINDILFVWTDTIIFAATEKNKCNLQKCGNFLIVSDFVFWFFLVNFGLPDKRWRYCSSFVYLLTSLNGCFIVYFFYSPLGGCILRQWLKLWIWYLLCFCLCVHLQNQRMFIHSFIRIVLWN